MSLGPREPRSTPRAPRRGSRTRRVCSGRERVLAVAERPDGPQAPGKQGRNDKPLDGRAGEGPVKWNAQTDSSGRSKAPQAEPFANTLRVSNRDRFADSHRPRKPFALRMQQVDRDAPGQIRGFAVSRHACGAGRSVPRFEPSMGPECRTQGAHVGPGRAETLGVGLGPVADEGAHVGPFCAGRVQLATAATVVPMSHGSVTTREARNERSPSVASGASITTLPPSLPGRTSSTTRTRGTSRA